MGLDLETVEQVRLAGLLHDLGKIAIPDRILQKPGKLDPDELRVMREHPELGCRLLEGLGVSPVDRWIRHHHEWWDGSGYPLGLAGDEIPLGSRIILVADAFDAMTSDRVYRAAGTAEAAIAELRRRSWTQFDARVVAALEEYLASESSHLASVESAPADGAAPRGRARHRRRMAAGRPALAAGRPAPARDLALLRRDRPSDRRRSRRRRCRGAWATGSRSASGSRPTPAWWSRRRATCA